MANQEHLDILNQGVEVWNQWRKEHPEIEPDLSLSSLHGLDLHEADLSKANLCEADLSDAILKEAILEKANLRQANLQHAQLHIANLNWANLSEADLRQADLFIALMSHTNFQQANLSEAILVGSHSFEAVYTDANFTGAILKESYFYSSDMRKVDLSRLDLSEAAFRDTNLSGANINDAIFRDGSLQGSDLRQAQVFGTSFNGIILSETDFTEALMGRAIFGAVDLSTTKGLDAIEHRRPSIIGIDCIYLSQGKIPEIFLRGVGIDDSFITYIRSLTAEPIRYYSSFISYSSKDEAFAQRLYTDLQSNNVRCWFAPEDMKTGDFIRSRIDEAIRIHDKLLLVLSQYSVESSWVAKEVETAFEKERQQKRHVLFPVRLDDSVMETSTSWAADIRRMRHITDFTDWKDHDAYQKAFGRLLRDLKAET